MSARASLTQALSLTLSLTPALSLALSLTLALALALGAGGGAADGTRVRLEGCEAERTSVRGAAAFQTQYAAPMATLPVARRSALEPGAKPVVEEPRLAKNRSANSTPFSTEQRETKSFRDTFRVIPGADLAHARR